MGSANDTMIFEWLIALISLFFIVFVWERTKLAFYLLGDRRKFRWEIWFGKLYSRHRHLAHPNNEYIDLERSCQNTNNEASVWLNTTYTPPPLILQYYNITSYICICSWRMNWKKCKKLSKKKIEKNVVCVCGFLSDRITMWDDSAIYSWNSVTGNLLEDQIQQQKICMHIFHHARSIIFHSRSTMYLMYY